MSEGVFCSRETESGSGRDDGLTRVGIDGNRAYLSLDPVCDPGMQHSESRLYVLGIGIGWLTGTKHDAVRCCDVACNLVHEFMTSFDRLPRKPVAVSLPLPGM